MYLVYFISKTFILSTGIHRGIPPTTKTGINYTCKYPFVFWFGSESFKQQSNGYFYSILMGAWNCPLSYRHWLMFNLDVCISLPQLQLLPYLEQIFKCINLVMFSVFSLILYFFLSSCSLIFALAYAVHFSKRNWLLVSNFLCIHYKLVQTNIFQALKKSIDPKSNTFLLTI